MVQLKQHSPPQWEYPRYQPGEPVAMFIPCYIDQFYPNIAQSMARLLTRLGVPLEFPGEQTCCGQPAFNSGYWEEARSVIHHFCDTFEKYPWIVCPSGSCTAMCRVFFGHVDPDPRIVEIGRRVVEFSEFLVECLGVTDVGARFPHKVTLHNGCHTRRELGVTEPPLKLLEKVRDMTYCRADQLGGVLRLRRHLQREDARHLAGHGQDQGRAHRGHRGRRGGFAGYQLPDARRRHPAAQPGQTRHIRTIHLAELLDAIEAFIPNRRWRNFQTGK